MDPTVVEARRPRLTKEEKATLRDGGTPEGCSKARARQIDRDGRWTNKRGRRATPPEGGAQRLAAAEIAVSMFGYKNHLGIDRGHGFIRRFSVTHAARHDGSQLGVVLDPNNTARGVWADTAYRGKANVELLDRRGLVPEFQRAKSGGWLMPAYISRGNATRARVRSLVEHVFATEKRRMGVIVRGIGLVRATARITLANLGYNMRRPVWIEGRGVAASKAQAPGTPERRLPPPSSSPSTYAHLRQNRDARQTHPIGRLFEVSAWRRHSTADAKWQRREGARGRFSSPHLLPRVPAAVAAGAPGHARQRPRPDAGARRPNPGSRPACRAAPSNGMLRSA
ncbi:transposase [Roseomonas sp. HF4]|uniref:transposase n=1 Tax=Roseomonas sp. HF4 TaxID=2562313 RepID=UPI0019802E76|nr:transposase [Roseomonas sp. HF4]